MNTSSSSRPVPNVMATRSEIFSLRDLAQLMIKSKRWVFAVFSLCVGLGLSYIWLGHPIYESSMLIQLESNATGSLLTGLLSRGGVVASSSLGGLLNSNQLAAEIEIIRSRTVASRTVDALNLTVSATPLRFPIFGSWISATRRENAKVDEDDRANWLGYAWGSESIRVDQMKVPRNLEDSPIQLTVLADHRYRLNWGSWWNKREFEGQIGIPLKKKLPTGEFSILVSDINALPGTHFTLIQSNFEAMVDQLQRSLSIDELGRNSGLLTVSFQSTSRDLSHRTLKGIGQAYLEQHIERKAEEAAKTLGFIETQLPKLREDLSVFEKQLTEHKKKHGWLVITDGQRNLINTSSAARTRLLQLQQQYAELETRYSRDHPNVQALISAIALQNEEITRVDSMIDNLPQADQEGFVFYRNVQVMGDLYSNLLTVSQQLKLIRSSQVGNVRVVDWPQMPDRPIKPQPVLIVLGSCLAGALAALTLVLIRQMLRTTIESPKELEEQLGLSVYATIVHSKLQYAMDRGKPSSGSGPKVLAVQDGFHPSIEGLRSLRTPLQLLSNDRQVSLTLITGPTPGAGKSFISTNLACVLAPVASRRVLLIDADLRLGGLHKSFHLEQVPGLSELVVGSADLDTVLHKDVVPGLDFISAGSVVANPADLLMHPKCMDWLNRLGEMYEQVVVDSPPVLAVSDSPSLSSRMTSVFLVVREDFNALREVSESIRRIQNAGGSVAGVIYNDMKPHGAMGKAYGARYAAEAYGRSA